jgi:hypothetical protein
LDLKTDAGAPSEAYPVDVGLTQMSAYVAPPLSNSNTPSGSLGWIDARKRFAKSGVADLGGERRKVGGCHAIRSRIQLEKQGE